MERLFSQQEKSLTRGKGENGNDKETTDGLFVVFQSFGIFREPAFQYPFALVEHFEYPPKGRERYDTENNTQVRFPHKGTNRHIGFRHEESPPASGSE